MMRDDVSVVCYGSLRGVQRLIYFSAECCDMRLSLDWGGSRGWFFFLDFCVAVRSRLSCADHLGVISLSPELSFSLRLR